MPRARDRANQRGLPLGHPPEHEERRSRLVPGQEVEQQQNLRGYARLEARPLGPRHARLERGDLEVLFEVYGEMMCRHGPCRCNARARRRGLTSRQGFSPQGNLRRVPASLRRGGAAASALHAGNAHNSVTETTLLSEPEAPAASVTVAVIVKLRGRMITYVWFTVKLPWVVLVPVLTLPSPQAIRYDHGPLPFASLKLKLVDHRRPVSACSSAPAFTTGALLGGVVMLNAALVAPVKPDALATSV